MSSADEQRTGQGTGNLTAVVDAPPEQVKGGQTNMLKKPESTGAIAVINAK